MSLRRVAQPSPKLANRILKHKYTSCLLERYSERLTDFGDADLPDFDRIPALECPADRLGRSDQVGTPPRAEPAGPDNAAAGHGRQPDPDIRPDRLADRTTGDVAGVPRLRKVRPDDLIIGIAHGKATPKARSRKRPTADR